MESPASVYAEYSMVSDLRIPPPMATVYPGFQHNPIALGRCPLHAHALCIAVHFLPLSPWHPNYSKLS